jgi:DNA-binding MarR family transcriptional regulator
VTEEAASLLARDLRHSIGAFVRAIRQDTGTMRSAQSEALDLLDRLGPMNVATLAERRGVTHQTMRLVVAQLDAAGLVRQDADPADRRSRLVSISATGHHALAREQDKRASRIEDAIRTRLSPTEQDLLRTVVPLLDRLTLPPDQTASTGEL